MFALACIASSVQAALDGVADTVQTVDDVFLDGSAFLLVEGESVAEIAGTADPATGWVVVDTDTPIQTRDMIPGAPPLPNLRGGLDVLPANTNAFGGGAIFDEQPDDFSLPPGTTSTATYEVEFALPGTYYLYAHWSVYNDSADNTSALNEDSFYVSPNFNLNSSTDWVGYSGTNAMTGLPEVADGPRDGYIDGFPSLVQIQSAANFDTGRFACAELDPAIATPECQPYPWEGNFNWAWLKRANAMDPNGAFQGFEGQLIRYDVAPEDVGTTLTFEIATREAYGAIDAILFASSNTLLESFTQLQLEYFIVPLRGDVDFDRDVDFDDIDDFVLGLNNPVEYESIHGVPPDLTGDINDDGQQDFDDIPGFVGILTGGETSSIPEPATWALAALAGTGMVLFKARRRRLRSTLS
jgi:hypothetical protein